MAVTLELGLGWRLVGDLAPSEISLAAAELEQVLGPPGDAGVEVVLSHDGGTGEGFRRRVAPGRLEVEGESPRGLLCGVYATLEDLGARWPWPGEHRTGSGRPALEDELEEGPALPGRCLVLGERALVEDAEDWIVWAARNRLNGMFVHVSTRRDPYGAAPEATWREHREQAIALAQERDMTLEHGGHLLPELLPRSAVRTLAGGDPLDDEARRALAEYMRAHPEADVLHLWGADVPSGAGREGSDAALRTANAVAEVAEDVCPGTEVAFLAYHDTEEAPRGVRPRHNVCLVFAPRERCYEHALADPDCRRNARYRELLKDQIEHFRAGDAAPPRVFEYWFDAILFAGGVPDLTALMGTDLAFYREAGVHTVQMLMTGHGRSPSSHPNPPAFARLSWDPAGRPQQENGE